MFVQHTATPNIQSVINTNNVNRLLTGQDESDESAWTAAEERGEVGQDDVTDEGWWTRLSGHHHWSRLVDNQRLWLLLRSCLRVVGH